MKDLKNLTNEEFDRILGILVKRDAGTLMTIPGVYEVISEHYNNEIIDIFESGEDELKINIPELTGLYKIPGDHTFKPTVDFSRDKFLFFGSVDDCKIAINRLNKMYYGNIHKYKMDRFL